MILFREEIFDHVSNTYLVFRKIKDEYGDYFSEKNDESLNNTLTECIRTICENNILNHDSNLSLIEELKKYKHFTINKEYYYNRKFKKDFNLLLLEYETNRILLNYLDSSRKFNKVEDYYIPNIYEKDYFSEIISINGKEYTIINTFDAFISFADSNGFLRRSETNREFFGYFIHSLSNLNKTLENGTIQDCKDLFCDQECERLYNYAVLDDVILIINYTRY